jgi:hypothetical protein
MGKLTNNDLTLKVGFDIDKFTSELQKTTGALNKWGAGITSQFTKIGAGIAAAFSVQAIAGFTKEVIKVTSEFEKFEAILTNTLGSNGAAKNSLYEITQLAAKTPFQIDEITAAYVRWSNMGLSPTMKNMNQIGDVASALGAGFEQTAEAFKDLMVGQTKRIEEVGISATQANGKIQLSFKGVNLEIEKTASGVQKALEVFSSLGGVQGTSAVIAETLGGKISNLEDKWTIFLKTLGEGNNGALGGAVSLLDKALAIATDLVKTTEQTKGENVMAQSGAVLDKYKTLDENGRLELRNKIYAKMLQLQMDIAHAEKNAHTASIPKYNQDVESLKIAIASIELIRSYNVELSKQAKIEDSVVEKKQKALKVDKDWGWKSLAGWQSTQNLPSKMGSVAKPELSNIGAWLTGMRDASKALEEKAAAEDAAATAAQNHADIMAIQTQAIANLAMSFGEGFGYMMSGAESFAVSMRKMANQVVNELFRVAEMAIVTKNVLALGPGGLIAAAAGLAALHGLVSGILSKGGGSSGGGASYSSGQQYSGRAADQGQRVEVVFAGDAGKVLTTIVDNQRRINGRTKA